MRDDLLSSTMAFLDPNPVNLRKTFTTGFELLLGSSRSCLLAESGDLICIGDPEDGSFAALILEFWDRSCDPGPELFDGL